MQDWCALNVLPDLIKIDKTNAIIENIQGGWSDS